MKFCIKCGSQLNDAAKFCNKCGSSQPNPSQVVSKAVKSDSSDTKSKTILYSIIGVLVVLLIGAGVWIFLEKMYKGKEEVQVYNYDSKNETDKTNKASVQDESIVSVTPVQETPVAVEETKAPAEVKESVSFNPYGMNYLKGKIDGKYGVSMVLDLGNRSGKYCYDKYGPKNSMTLIVTYQSGNYLTIEEYNKYGDYCGEWSGSVSNGVFKGTGTFHDKDMPFKLSLISASKSVY